MRCKSSQDEALSQGRSLELHPFSRRHPAQNCRIANARNHATNYTNYTNPNVNGGLQPLKFCDGTVTHIQMHQYPRVSSHILTPYLFVVSFGPECHLCVAESRQITNSQFQGDGDILCLASHLKQIDSLHI